MGLVQLHQLIQIAHDWDDCYLHQFHIYGKDYGLYRDDDIMFSNNIHKVFIDA
ncbi:IS1096 element passenger TnpR family protein [Facilibium subflavum]|uniref:IS1096 element passenger TnpR family protein n=1 Tax=Facilibium subflavum TaxID=2219058 RepID=UPI000E64791F